MEKNSGIAEKNDTEKGEMKLEGKSIHRGIMCPFLGRSKKCMESRCKFWSGECEECILVVFPTSISDFVRAVNGFKIASQHIDEAVRKMQKTTS